MTAGKPAVQRQRAAEVDPAIAGLDVYIVGGAVRDALLGRAAQDSDRDWVVVGATPEQMADRGFIPVGGDFPVFLHPRSKEEYALARTERKSGRGYKGFTFYTGTDVTLEDDLQRRDLTINAIAQAPDGRLVDPLGGRADIRDRIFRHVGQAFVEDPVRLLRLARFAARFPDFSIAPETMDLARRLVDEGEVDALVPERVWREIAKGLACEEPGRMFQVLHATGALPRIMPGFIYDSSVLEADLACAARRGLGLASRFALACRLSDSPQDIGRHLRAPGECLDHARLLPEVVDALSVQSRGGGPDAWLDLMERCDALRKPARFMDLIAAANCVSAVDIDGWRKRVDAMRSIDAGAIALAMKGQPERIKAALREARLRALQDL
ncbi:tRNA CCA-pyrophosphorylase [Parapusillimonas sp. JC17]|uniref:tRNA CCA-pyrophosphorylase n=1 Tax=Parapusillimonas sp. JC17 TaxID=3445768 RepID=UPI003F9FA9FA